LKSITNFDVINKEINNSFDDLIDTKIFNDFKISNISFDDLNSILLENYDFDYQEKCKNPTFKFIYNFGLGDDNRYVVLIHKIKETFPTVYLFSIYKYNNENNDVNVENIHFRLIIQKIYGISFLSNITKDDFFLARNRDPIQNDNDLFNGISDDLKRDLLNINGIASMYKIPTIKQNDSWINKIKANIPKYSDIVKFTFKYNDPELFITNETRVLELLKRIKKEIGNGDIYPYINYFINADYINKVAEHSLFKSSKYESEIDVYKSLEKKMYGRMNYFSDLADIIDSKKVDIFLGNDIQYLISALILMLIHEYF
jgi:hypothetical protein